jgi:hypothetical protein
MLNQIGHIEWPCLVKLTILIWLVNLLAMLARLPTYLPIYNLPTYILLIFYQLIIIYFTIYLLTIYLPN